MRKYEYEYQSSREENIQWDDIVHGLDEGILLSIERYDQMEKKNA